MSQLNVMIMSIMKFQIFIIPGILWVLNWSINNVYLEKNRGPEQSRSIPFFNSTFDILYLIIEIPTISVLSIIYGYYFIPQDYPVLSYI